MFKQLIRMLIAELESTEYHKSFGRGWISGTIALIISVASLFTVICLKYPTFFVTPEMRKIVDVVYIEFILQAALIVGFILAVVSLILRQNKTLGLTSAFLVILTVTFAGMKESTHSSALYLGLDWLTINLLFTGFIFVPLEKLFHRKKQSILRDEWRVDLFYFAFNSLMVQSLNFLSQLPSLAILQHTNMHEIQVFVGSLPFIIQVLVIMFLTDLVQYWFHRSFHEIPFLWKFHSIHHSTETLDWLAGARMHLLEVVLLRGVTVVPMFVLGFDQQAIYTYVAIVYMYSTYIHSNVRLDSEFISPILTTPRYHHWHHGKEKEAININYAIHFPIIDRIFGTYYMPPKKWPSIYGVVDNTVPKGFVRQFLHPFRRT